MLEDPCRTLVVSDYVWLEVLPKPRFHKRADEIMFMETVLDAAENIEASPKVAEAGPSACQHVQFKYHGCFACGGRHRGPG